jgi:hypothetical protein
VSDVGSAASDVTIAAASLARHAGDVDVEGALAVRSEVERRTIGAEPRVALVGDRVEIEDGSWRLERIALARARGVVEIAPIFVCRRRVNSSVGAVSSGFFEFIM